MIRVALIAGTYQPKRCGVAHYTACLREALAERGIESVVLTTSGASQMIDPQISDSSVLGVVNQWQLADLLPLVRAVHTTGADLLHIQHAAGTYGFDRAIFLLPLLLRLTGWRNSIVTTVHEYGWWEWQPRLIPLRLLEGLKSWGQQQGWWDREDGFLLTQSNALIATNRDAESIIEARLPHLKPQIHRIPMGANVQVAPIERLQARQKLRQECGWTEDVAIAVFFGFLHPVKGLETLLSAFPQVLAVQPQARLLLVGGVESLALRAEQATQYWNKLKDRISELNLEGKVHLTGYVNADIASQYLSGADVGVLPFNHGVTLKSGSLLALLAHGLPVIATQSTPPDSDLSREHWIRAIAPRDVEGLATELIKRLGDPAWQYQLGTAGYHFSRQFSWSSIANAHLEVYQTVLARSLTPPRFLA